jgi:hypothetical protein
MKTRRPKTIAGRLGTAEVMLTFGIVSIVISIFITSSILVFIGLGLTFWGALLRYVAPSEQASLRLLTATAISTLADIEKLLTDLHITAKGIYLPPKNLKDFESSLVFIPSKAQQPLPTREEADETTLYSRNPEGLLLTPPGLALSKLLEKELGTSFTKTDLSLVQERLPKLLIEDTEIAETTEVKTENNTVTIEITNHIFSGLSRETAKLTRTRESIGCPLSSALACALAKATGKPITIENEQESQDGKTTRIQYRILEK